MVISEKMNARAAILLAREREGLKSLLAKFPGLKVLVIGDLILDEYVWGNVSRISPEAPVPVVEVVKQSYSPGGASYVASLVQYLGGEAYIVGVVGGDLMGKRLKALLKSEGARADGIIEDVSRPTTHKVRVMAQRQQIVRIDHENRNQVSEHVSEIIGQRVDQWLKQVHAVIISDYAKGVLTPVLVHSVIRRAQARRVPVIVDPKPASGIHFRGATIMTPNTAEAGQLTGLVIHDEASAVKAGHALMRRVGCRNVLITRGEAGLSLFQKGGNVTHIPTRAREIFDVSGAGDAVVSSLALALAAGATMVQAAELANYAAGVEVSKLGTAKITRQEIAAAIDLP